LAWILKEKWFWIIVLAVGLIVIVPFIIITIILEMPPYLRVVGVVLLVLCWGVAGAFKDWTKEKREQEQKMGQPGPA
jgi:hypothetical protein